MQKTEYLWQMSKLKLIWDFKGPNAFPTAKHHTLHLREYIRIEGLAHDITGFEELNDYHAIAFMVVNDDEMKKVRDKLKPHRGQRYIK